MSSRLSPSGLHAVESPSGIHHRVRQAPRNRGVLIYLDTPDHPSVALLQSAGTQHTLHVLQAPCTSSAGPSNIQQDRVSALQLGSQVVRGVARLDPSVVNDDHALLQVSDTSGRMCVLRMIVCSPASA